MSKEACKPGQRVRVRDDCPHTLPYYARMFLGEVLSVTDEGEALVRFGDDREFPIPMSCLELTE